MPHNLELFSYHIIYLKCYSYTKLNTYIFFQFYILLLYKVHYVDSNVGYSY